MPVKIPSTLPARATLENENVFVMDEESLDLSQEVARAERLYKQRFRCSLFPALFLRREGGQQRCGRVVFLTTRSLEHL